MNKPPITTSTCSPREAARQLGVSVRTAQLWVEEGRLQAWKAPGGHRRIPAIENVVRECEDDKIGIIDVAVVVQVSGT